MGSVWEPSRIERFPGLLSVTDVVTGMQNIFAPFPVPDPVWRDVEKRLSFCKLARLQHCTAWSRMKSMDWQVLGPVPVTRQDRARIYAGLSGQRRPADSKQGLDHLLQPGLGPEEHMMQASQLPSPFSPTPWPEPDVGFVVDALLRWRQFLPLVAKEQRHILETVARAVRPLDQSLDLFRC